MTDEPAAAVHATKCQPRLRTVTPKTYLLACTWPDDGFDNLLDILSR